MAISKIKGSAIQDATIPEDKLEDEAGSFRMILDASDGSATDAGDFLLLDATASSTNVGEQFLFEPATDDGSAVLSGDLNLEMDKKSTIKSEGGAVTTNIGQGLAKAWITFSGVGDAIRDSSNVASLVDDGTGVQSYNVTSSMSNTHYTSSTGASFVNETANYETYLSMNYVGNLSATRTTSQNNVGFWESAYAEPANDACSSIHGDLA